MPPWPPPLRFPAVRDATPSERSLALFRIADAFEARRNEPGANRVQEHGQADRQ